jgi:hypothetical protein
LYLDHLFAQWEKVEEKSSHQSLKHFRHPLDLRFLGFGIVNSMELALFEKIHTLQSLYL